MLAFQLGVFCVGLSLGIGLFLLVVKLREVTLIRVIDRGPTVSAELSRKPRNVN